MLAFSISNETVVKLSLKPNFHYFGLPSLKHCVLIISIRKVVGVSHTATESFNYLRLWFCLACFFLLSVLSLATKTLNPKRQTGVLLQFTVFAGSLVRSAGSVCARHRLDPLS